jgi:GT2 family glycosyltransferase/SAM-dependent methyltransferase
MDHHAGFASNHADMLIEEKNLLASADLVLASSLLLEREARRHNSRALLLRNACDYEHFAAAAGPVAPRQHPVIGYYGAIAEWFDSDLVATLARRRPEWCFILVGSTFGGDTAGLAKLENVELHGEKPYAEIPSYLASFDVAILPFRSTPLTQATNPVKAYEMLAAGKPLVSVPLPEMVAMAPLVALASNPEEFEREIETALSNPDPEKVEARRAFARENTWKRRFEELAPAVARAFPLASLVIVTYNNLKLNRLCLESVFDQTGWPNLEVFVVDNGSSDGTAEYLREAQGRFAGLRVLFNETNLGFAAANNLALKEASGEFVVLLNNDVVVAHGWLSTLLRHLRARPDIGMVGPVTNAIGNEAKVEVGYSRIEEMPDWAAAYTRAHDGELFEIPMLAMFCVAMRRAVFEKVGPLDERFGIGMFEDDDYALRMKEAGYRLICARDSFVHHWMKASFRKMPAAQYDELFERNRRLFEEKWDTPWVPHRGPEPPPAEEREQDPPELGQALRAPGIDTPAAAGGNGHGPFEGVASLPGRCNICGNDTDFYFEDPGIYRESLTCAQCLATSRYRSIARGILKAVRMLTGVEADSLAALSRQPSDRRLAVYDTQVPFRYDTNAYPIPEFLSRCPWIDLAISRFQADQRPGKKLGPKTTNQNLEKLTFPSGSFDIVITSDVLEHVRLDDAAHREIRRVLRPGGAYLFTVPHFRTSETLVRVKIHDPGDPSRDEFLTEKEYHGDANSEEGAALSYRAYGTDLDARLAAIGFEVEYCKEDFPELGIFNTELFFCRVKA